MKLRFELAGQELERAERKKKKEKERERGRERKRSIVMIGPSSFQKESWDGIKGTLFIFRSRNEFVNFSKWLE